MHTCTMQDVFTHTHVLVSALRILLAVMANTFFKDGITYHVSSLLAASCHDGSAHLAGSPPVATARGKFSALPVDTFLAGGAISAAG